MTEETHPNSTPNTAVSHSASSSISTIPTPSTPSQPTSPASLTPFIAHLSLPPSSSLPLCATSHGAVPLVGDGEENEHVDSPVPHSMRPQSARVHISPRRPVLLRRSASAPLDAGEHFEDRLEVLRHEADEQEWDICMPVDSHHHAQWPRRVGRSVSISLDAAEHFENRLEVLKHESDEEWNICMPSKGAATRSRRPVHHRTRSEPSPSIAHGQISHRCSLSKRPAQTLPLPTALGCSSAVTPLNPVGNSSCKASTEAQARLPEHSPLVISVPLSPTKHKLTLDVNVHYPPKIEDTEYSMPRERVITVVLQ